MAKAKPHNWRKWNEFRDNALDEGLNEGPAYENAKEIKNVVKTYDAYWDAVKDLEKALNKQGHKDYAKLLTQKYKKQVTQFQQWFDMLVSKLQ